MSDNTEMILSSKHDVYDVHKIPKLIEKGRIILSDQYDDLYNDLKSRVVESVLLCLPIPPIGATEDREGNLTIRSNEYILRSLVDFYEGKFRLSGLRYLQNLNGSLYDEISGIHQNRIWRKELDIYWIFNGKNNEVLEQMFFDSIEGDF